MSAPVPKSAAVDLWNHLTDLGRDDGAEVDRIIWQLRGLVARKPSDFDARLGLAWAFLARAQRVDGLSHLDAAWNLRHGQSFLDLSNLMTVLVDCGKLAEAADLGHSLLEYSEARHFRKLWLSMGYMAYRTGDLSYWDRAMPIIREATPVEQRWRQRVQENGLEDAFRNHQALVESIVGPYTCSFDGEVQADWEGGICAYLEYFTDLDDDARFELEGAIAERLDSDDLIRVADYVTVAVRGPFACRIEAAA